MSKTRFFTIPEPVRLRALRDHSGAVVAAWAPGDDGYRETLAGGEPWPELTIDFARDFVRRMLLDDEAWGRTLARLYLLMEVRDAVKGRAPGEIVELEDEAWAALVEVMRAPSRPYAVPIAMHLAAFFRALEGATSERPAARANGAASAADVRPSPAP